MFVLSWARIHFQIGTGAVFSSGTSPFWQSPWFVCFGGTFTLLRRSSCRRLSALSGTGSPRHRRPPWLLAPRAKVFLATMGALSTLQEYAFRVRLRAARDQAMDPNELKKHGPLGYA